MSRAVGPIFGANQEEVDAVLVRQARDGLVLRYFLAPLLVIPIACVFAIAARLTGAGQALLQWTIIAFSGFMIGTVSVFYAHRAARALPSGVKLGWYGYAMVIWVLGCGLLVTFVTSLSLYEIH